MKAIYFFILGLGILSLNACMHTQPNSIRTEITEPEFIAIPIVDDSTEVSPVATYFYHYHFGSRDDDWNMTPEWAIANLYHGGIKVIEAWYARTSSPKRPGNAATGTMYPPLLVVGIAGEDTYMAHFHFERDDNFNPVAVSKTLTHRLIHYVSK